MKCSIGLPWNRTPSPKDVERHDIGEPRKCLVYEAGLNEPLPLDPVYEPEDII